MKSRSSTGVGQKIDLEYNIETMRITDEGGDENGHNKPQSSIMDSIKARSQVAPADSGGTTQPWEKPRPRDGHDPLSGRVTADVQSNKLKQLLGQIKAS